MCGVLAFDGPGACPRAEALLYESSVRGLHAFGLARWDGGRPVPRRSLVMADVQRWLAAPAPFIAHARYSTSGDWRDPGNNQPIVAAGRALVFNGCLHMGTKPEFEAAFGVRCDSDNDGEVFLRRLEAGQPAGDFLREVSGSFAGAWWENGRILVARNPRRPLWILREGHTRIVASTRDVFRRAGFSTEPEPVPPGEVIAL